MAAGAVDRERGPVVIRMLRPEICMTTEAGIGPVDGGRQPAGIHIQRDCATGGVGNNQRLISMAIQTILIGHGPGRPGPVQRPAEEEQNRQEAEKPPNRLAG